jgi:hypothetical protein
MSGPNGFLERELWPTPDDMGVLIQYSKRYKEKVLRAIIPSWPDIITLIFYGYRK